MTWKTGSRLVKPEQVKVGDMVVCPYSGPSRDEKIVKILRAKPDPDLGGRSVIWLIGEHGSELEYWPAHKVRIRVQKEN